jgi:4-carboxymuconolactone decarboxylase
METGNGNRAKTRLLAVLVLTLVTALSAPGLRAQDRMPPLSPEKMTEAQKKAAAEYKALRGSDLNAPPWSVLSRVPDLVMPVLQMRVHNQTNSALSPKLTELAILIAARHWTNNFEWNAHYDAAAKAGLSPEIIAAVADGRRPPRMSEDEQILYDFCMELMRNQSVSDATYARAVARLGEPGVVEATSLEGYYAFLAILMNMARSPLPAGAKPALVPFPR